MLIMTVAEAQALHTPNMTPGQQAFAGCMYVVFMFLLFGFMLRIKWFTYCEHCGALTKYNSKLKLECTSRCSKSQLHNNENKVLVTAHKRQRLVAGEACQYCGSKDENHNVKACYDFIKGETNEY